MSKGTSILGWCFGIFFVLVGLGSLSPNPVPGLAFLLIAAMLLPPVSKLLKNRWNVSLPTGVKVGVVVICLLIAGATSEKQDERTGLPSEGPGSKSQYQEKAKGGLAKDSGPDQDAGPSGKPEDGEAQMPPGPTPQDEKLLSLVISGDSQGVKEMLWAGANPNARSKYGRTALEAAASNGRAEIVKLLLEKGADVNARLDDGGTALHGAVYHSHLDVVKLLIQAGAGVNVEAKGGITPLQLAMRRKNPEIVRMIKDAGGR